MSSSPFIAGDARVLSGGLKRALTGTYDNTPYVVRPGRDEVLEYPGPDGDALAAASRSSQAIYRGRGRYHLSHLQPHNVFLVEGDPLPTAGVELETIANRDLAGEYGSLKSNWFRFENDGSLGCDGHELVTDPLPARVYRDIRTWTGLRNLLVGRFRSYGDSSTGLHVHVGLSTFCSCGTRTFESLSERSRRGLGGLMSAAVYFALLDRAFLDRVFLRLNTTYCDVKVPRSLLAIAGVLRAGGLSGYDLMDHLIREFTTPDMFMSHVYDLAMGRTNEFDGLTPGGSAGFGVSTDAEFTGHNSEVNLAHSYTVEFRRGKGTLNGESVHRMVDFCSLVVRYAEYIARNPETRPTRKDAYGFIIDNTASQSLKDLAGAVRKEII